MADTGAERPATEEEKPSDGRASDNAEPEIVEAEIVDAEFSEAEEAGDQENAPSEESAPPDETPAPASRLRSFAMLGALIFALLVIAAALSFFLKPAPKKAPQTAAPTVESAPAAPSEEPAPTEKAPEEIQPEEPAPAAPSASKILNSFDDDTKADAAALGAVTAPETNSATSRGLPPPPPAGSANDSLQQAAKDALKDFGAKARDGAATAPEAETEPEINFEVDGAQPDEQSGEQPETEEDAPPSDLAEASASDAPSSQITAEPAAGGAFAGLMNGPAANDSAPAASTQEESASSAGDAPQAQETAAAQNQTAEAFAALQQQIEDQDAARGAEIDALRDSIDRALARRNAEANAEIASLKDEVADLRAKLGATPRLASPEAAVALSALQRVVDRGDPYTEELEKFERYAPQAPAVKTLAPMAEQGAPTMIELQQSFDPAAREALAAASREEAKGWFSSLLSRLPQLVSVRPATPQPGSKPPQIISRAEARLNEGDLAGAVSELSALQGAAAEAFASWTVKAQERIGADKAIDSLETAFLAEYGN